MKKNLIIALFSFSMMSGVLFAEDVNVNNNNQDPMPMEVEKPMPMEVEVPKETVQQPEMTDNNNDVKLVETSPSMQARMTGFFNKMTTNVNVEKMKTFCMDNWMPITGVTAALFGTYLMIKTCTPVRRVLGMEDKKARVKPKKVRRDTQSVF